MILTPSKEQSDTITSILEQKCMSCLQIDIDFNNQNIFYFLRQ